MHRSSRRHGGGNQGSIMRMYVEADENVHPGMQLKVDHHRSRRDIEESCAYAIRDAWELATALGTPLPGIHWPVVSRDDVDYHFLPYQMVLDRPQVALELGHLHILHDGPPLARRPGETPLAPGTGMVFVGKSRDDGAEDDDWDSSSTSSSSPSEREDPPDASPGFETI